MRDALYKTGRPIVFSICEWGDNKPWEWAKPIGHLWRTTGDIYNCFDCINDHGTWKSWGVMQILDMQEGLRKYAGPGHWNDPDMLEVGNGKLTIGEDRAHFTMWAMLAAPLVAGNDIRTMTPETKAILTNKEVIAINQDELGIQGFKYATKDSVETWVKPLKDGKWAISFLNRSKHNQKINFDWKQHIIEDKVFQKTLDTSLKTYKLKNLWTNQESSNTNTPLNAEIPAHDILVLRLE